MTADTSAAVGTEHTVLATPLGELTAVRQAGALTGLYFPHHWPRPDRAGFGARADRGFGEVARQLGEYFAGQRETFGLRLEPRGTPFQHRVWQLIAQVPYGQTASYGELARRLGGDATPQEVGTAVASNPLCILIPCHRVIGSTGKLTGYAGGLARKRALLDLEQAENLLPASAASPGRPRYVSMVRVSEMARLVERRAGPYGEVALRRRGECFEVIANGCFLMDSSDGRSERLMVSAALGLLQHPHGASVLIGGLGVGFSLAEACADPRPGRICVVEREQAVIDWHTRGAAPLRRFAGTGHSDPRARIIAGDLLRHVRTTAERYDVLCLDIDNGPDWTVTDGNRSVYQPAGLAALGRVLTGGGVLSVWSAAPAPELVRRLAARFARVETREVPLLPGRRGEPDVVILASRRLLRLAQPPVYPGEFLVQPAQRADSLGPGLLPAVAEDRHRVAEHADGPADRGRRRVECLRVLAPGLRGRVIPRPAAVRAPVAEQPGLVIHRFRCRAAADAGELVLPGLGAGPGTHLLRLGHPGHDVIQLRMAAQHGLVVPGLVGFVQPDQYVDLHPRELKSVRQRPLHRPVPLGPRNRAVLAGSARQRRGGFVWLHHCLCSLPAVPFRRSQSLADP
jgi:O-6-methylguanine DNA methyltransferase